MGTKRKFKGSGLSRAKFLGFLGKIGLLSLIAGPAYAAEKARVKIGARETISAESKDIAISASAKLTRSPSIKGQILSSSALKAKLSTENLENIRDLLTGRFFGKTAEAAFLRGSCPEHAPLDFVNWNLGTEHNDSGCFLFADTGGEGDVDNCTQYLTYRMDADRLIVEFARDFSKYRVGEKINLSGGGSGQCSHCGEYCDTKCKGGFCVGVCNPKAEIHIYELISYPGDKFAAEILDILKTTDVGVIQYELKAVIFSDDVLNMGLAHFLTATQENMAEEIEEIGILR